MLGSNGGGVGSGEIKSGEGRERFMHNPPAVQFCWPGLVDSEVAGDLGEGVGTGLVSFENAGVTH